jgi:hypothetical protein
MVGDYLQMGVRSCCLLVMLVEYAEDSVKQCDEKIRRKDTVKDKMHEVWFRNRVLALVVRLFISSRGAVSFVSSSTVFLHDRSQGQEGQAQRGGVGG